MKKNGKKAPVLGQKLISLLGRYESEYSASGDCREEFSEMVEVSGRRRALFWYWRQVIHAVVTYGALAMKIGVAMINNYIKITWRNIRNNKVYSLINILGLAVGMALCFMILLWVQDEMSYDRFHENYDHIYRAIPEMNGIKFSATPLALGATIKAQYPEVLKVTRFYPISPVFRVGDDIFNPRGAMVDDDFFNVFTFPLLHGTPESVLANPESIVLTEETAAKYFGSRNPVGKIIGIASQNRDMVVTGVVKDAPKNSHLRFDFLISTRILGKRGETSWSYEPSTYVLLQRDTDFPEFSSKIFGFIMAHDKRTNQTVNLYMQPLSRVHLYSLNGTDPIIYMYIFLTVAAAILIIAGINFINLSTARANTRAREIGMRKVVGAGRKDIIRQFIGESILFSVIAFIFAVGLVYLVLPFFNRIAEKEMILGNLGQISVFPYLIGIVLLTGIASGLYPALMLSSFKPAQILSRGKNQSRAGGFGLRKVLVVSQFSAAIILIIGTLVMAKQLRFIKNMDTGMDRKHVVALRMNRELLQKSQAFQDVLRSHPNILNVTASRNYPTRIGHFNPVYWEGTGPDNYVQMTDASVDYDYFETLGIEILEGRRFSKEFESDKHNYILNEKALELTELESPIGKMFSIWEDEGQIIGIVKDFNTQSLRQDIGPVVFYMSQRHGSHNYILAKIKPDDIPGTIAFLKKTNREFAPNNIFSYSFLDDEFDRMYGSDRRQGAIYKAFSILAVFISCLGLFGMASYTAEQRTKEIGIRKVLGASVSSIMAMISKDFLILLAVSNLIAWPVAYFLMNQMLKGYSYRTGLSIWIFIAAGVAAIVVALITVCLKVIRAAHADPVNSLRYE